MFETKLNIYVLLVAFHLLHSVYLEFLDVCGVLKIQFKVIFTVTIDLIKPQ